MSVSQPNNKSMKIGNFMVKIAWIYLRDFGFYRITRFFLFIKQLHQPGAALKSLLSWAYAHCNAYALVLSRVYCSFVIVSRWYIAFSRVFFLDEFSILNIVLYVRY